VNCCGFDSIPSDLGSLMVVRHMQTKLVRNCGELKYLIGVMKGGASGGTLASGLGMFELPKEVLKEMRDPFYLNPPTKKGSPQGDMFKVRFDEDVQKWTAPFVMGPCNCRIVRRSNALLDNSYGPNFKYTEALTTTSWIKAVGVWIGLLGFVLLASFSFTRNILRKVVPQPGEGPTEKERKEGMFKITLVGKTDTKEPGEKPHEVRAQVNGYSDPGYQETSKMISESAICLATLPADSIRGGVLTPASSMGMTLVERLRNAGMTFEITNP